MKNCNMISKKNASKISALLSTKIDQYEYLTDEEYYHPMKVE